MSFFQPKIAPYIVGPAAALPERVVTNREVLDWMGSSARASWIAHRSGIETRHWVAEDEATSDLAVQAGQRLLAAHRLDPERVRQLVLATISGDHPAPPTAPQVAQRLGLIDAGVFDVGAACAGFVTGLHIAASLHQATKEETMAIAADIRSKFLNPADLATSALFGDGAAACFVTARPEHASFRFVAGMLSSDPSVADLIGIFAGGSRRPGHRAADDSERYLRMKSGPALFLKGVEVMAASAEAFLRRMDLSVSDVDWVVPHQANLRLMRAVAEKLQLDPERMVETVQFTGNTAGASVGIALHHLLTELRCEPGQRVLLVSAGGGGSSACALLERVSADGGPS